MKRLIAAVVMICAIAAPAAADLEGGLAAYERGDYAAAFDLLTPLAQAGNADAQVRLGHMFHAGEGVAQDFVSAASWFQKAAEAGLGEAQNGLGRLYYNGEGVPQDFAEAARWYRSAAALGVAEAMDNLASLYLRGEGVPQDFAEATRWYLAGARKGRAEAQYNHGLMYYEGKGVPQDYAEALRWFRRAAAQHLGRAMSTIGEMYQLGRGVPRDAVRAYAWFNVGTALAPAPARVLAVLARDRAAAGLSPQDLALSQRLARDIHTRIGALAKAPRPPSASELAALTPELEAPAEEPAAQPAEPAAVAEERPPVGREPAVEVPLHKGLAALGEPAAYRALDYWRAAKFWLPLARRGHPRAQRLLGQLYFDGTGVPSNPVQAYFWWTLAARQGDDESRTMLAAIAARSPDALVVARLLAESWTPVP